MNPHKIEKIPLSMAWVFFELDKKDTNEMNDCTRKFLDYLTKFKKTSSFESAEALQNQVNKIEEETKNVTKDLVQIWNLDLRARDQIQEFFPKLAQKLSAEKIEGYIKVLQAYNK